MGRWIWRGSVATVISVVCVLMALAGMFSCNRPERQAPDEALSLTCLADYEQPPGAEPPPMPAVTPPKGKSGATRTVHAIRKSPMIASARRPAPTPQLPSLDAAVSLDAQFVAGVGGAAAAHGMPAKKAPEMALALPKAHGGTNNVNDAPADAMFFRNYGVNPFVDADEDHLSTFAVDVDTGSYTLCRSYLNRGHVPPKDAARVEEFVNYFDYHYAPPKKNAGAFAIHTELAPSQFGKGKLMMRVGLKGYEISAEQRKDAVLTFVIDTSGSMSRESRLGAVKKALRMLVDQLREGDLVGIVEYGSRGRVVLRHHGVDGKGNILKAIEGLSAHSSTNAEEGLTIGYKIAADAFKEGAINRIILCSDGVANVGRTGPKSILKIVERHVKRGITLSAIGFGMGNYNDVLMEQLGDKGNGHYAYVDTLAEARRIFVDNLTGNLQVIARDVKIQVDFNSKAVRSYRLIGYENRNVADKDFRNDQVDGGEVGAGHSVTALYELKLWPKKVGMLATVRVRYKDPDFDKVTEVAHKVKSADAVRSFKLASPSFRLAATVAEFAEVLRASYWARGRKMSDVLASAKACAADFDKRPDVAEFVALVAKAAELKADDHAKATSSLEE
jgi:Ca-activated chloride channel homolog